MSFSFYWHDYETSGADPRRDRPLQFAGVRTDAELNEIGEPLMLYCQPSEDLLPHPEACLITGITPQQALAAGVPEHVFIARILAELGQPGTCGTGYNTLRFDDEFTRHTLYRNFHDPYEREWRNGNSRWDLIDVVRLAYAMRPEGVVWPRREDGSPIFKLEALSAANGLSHEHAHDALSDVRATIGLARLLKQAQPRLFDYALSLRDKQVTAKLLNVAERRPVLHISEKYPAARGCAALVVPLAFHPTNRNEVIVFDLSADPSPLLALAPDDIRLRVFSRQEALPEGVQRLPLKTVRLNRSPVLVPYNRAALEEAGARERLGLDLDTCQRHWQQLQGVDFTATLHAVFGEREFAPEEDPECRLYDGFLPDADRALCRRVRTATPEQLRDRHWAFADGRLQALLFRYRARQFPASLTDEEHSEWQRQCRARLSSEQGFGLPAFRRALAEAGETSDPARAAVLAALAEWGDSVAQRFGVA